MNTFAHTFVNASGVGRRGQQLQLLVDHVSVEPDGRTGLCHVGMQLMYLFGCFINKWQQYVERQVVLLQDIYLRCAVKLLVYEEYMKKYGLHDHEVIFVGDDIPDYEVMARCGCPCCPADACAEIKSVSRYISQRNGGYGVGRDIIEQVLKAQGKWMGDKTAFGW